MKVKLQELIYLTLLLLFCCVMVAVRIRYTRFDHYDFLYWNLFLAFIPLLVSLGYVNTRERFKGWFWLSVCLFFWLLFFPNSPYIVTDLMHLNQHDYMPRWYDGLMVVASALTGLWAGFLSLREFEAELWHRIGLWPTRLFIAGVWFLSGIGIYLGRVLRWNSWDLFRHPDHLVRDIVMPFLRPGEFTQPLALILLYGTFFWLSYLFWRSHQGSEPGPQGSKSRHQPDGPDRP